MKVKELMELLSKFDSDMEVVTYCDPNRDFGTGHVDYAIVSKGFFEDESKSAVELRSRLLVFMKVELNGSVH